MRISDWWISQTTDAGKVRLYLLVSQSVKSCWQKGYWSSQTTVLGQVKLKLVFQSYSGCWSSQAETVGQVKLSSLVKSNKAGQV